MLKKFRSSIAVFAIALVSVLSVGFMTPTKVAADSLVCDIFPFIKSIGFFGISNICTGDANVVGENAATQTANLVQLVLQLIFVGIIIIAVYIIIKAAVQYIRSEGDEEKVKNSQKAIKTVFIGIAALFIGILGIVIVLAFFQAGGVLQDGGETTGIPFLDNLFNAFRT